MHIAPFEIQLNYRLGDGLVFEGFVVEGDGVVAGLVGVVAGLTGVVAGLVGVREGLIPGVPLGV